jgi:chemotaxis protein methyltransferase CheR
MSSLQEVEPTLNLALPSDSEFALMRDLIYHQTGITLSDSKRTLVSSRLAKRLRALRLNSYREYYNYLMAPGHTAERQEMINCITTNKTDFFRENHHFEFLLNEAFPQIEARAKRTGKRQLRIWCAASSRGHEPYSLAITAHRYFGAERGWDIRILATDIDTEVLAYAQRGIYPKADLEPISRDLCRQYFLRGTGKQAGLCQVQSDLRSMLTFRQLNLVHPPWPFKRPFDLIFCRNVMIYFDRPTQGKVLNEMVRHLPAEGYLFLGHSENICYREFPFVPLGATVYALKPKSN